MLKHLLYTTFYLLITFFPASSIDPTFSQMLIEVREIQDNLATPKVSVRIDTVLGGGYNRFTGCLTVLSEYTYATDQPITKIIEEYEHNLYGTEWVLNPVYKPNKKHDHLFMWNQDQARLSVYLISDYSFSHPNRLDFRDTPYKTIYLVEVSLYDQPANDCFV